ncbi:hypothetical protein [Streptosporangium amethystogenes]|uniref:hypothetical protein n=1 Tax=Streptosporangium amethystogenes TaxID=2002 RepID=UPI0012F777D0|nr:hypothetical protein [Streptosporangium amethystogenes]
MKAWEAVGSLLEELAQRQGEPLQRIEEVHEQLARMRTWLEPEAEVLHGLL